jgi:hypothetical protein
MCVWIISHLERPLYRRVSRAAFALCTHLPDAHSDWIGNFAEKGRDAEAGV